MHEALPLGTVMRLDLGRVVPPTADAGAACIGPTEVVRVDVRRSIPSDVRLSAREARALRRIEDAAVAEDPLLDVRLGLPLNRFERSVVGLRRRSKAIGRTIVHRSIALVVAVNALVLVLALLATESFTIAAVLALPIAFVLGIAISRPPRLLTTSANVGMRRIREHPRVE